MRKTLYYTFGNHMHWVDMEWLWGYGALPGSVRDMLRLIRETGARGNVNFDAVGYEKMAAEAPEALSELREAVRDGWVEVVGASYGQPYGLFHGGESNVRQRVYGARAVMRLLGTRPRAFWEEEFDFCPQLPQILKGCGYTGASLFFQWTWHTPEVPRERHSVIVWEGIDGSALPAAPRNDLCLHQWPEDFAGLLESPLLSELEKPAIVQWLELMPSPDWMCRSELLLPKLRELLADRRFEVKCVTLSGLLEALGTKNAPVRRYGMGDVFHGVSLGKNGDHMRRWSRRAERNLLAAESLSALAGLFGRPYPGWDVYPTWELEEGWRELLSAQHHDNDECEGLCGGIGELSYERATGLAEGVAKRTLRRLASRSAAPKGSLLVYNPLGWPRDLVVRDPESGAARVASAVPAFGYATLNPAGAFALGEVRVEETESTVALVRGSFRVAVDRARGVVTQIESPLFPRDLLDPGHPLADLEMVRGGEPERFEKAEVVLEPGRPCVKVIRTGRDGASVEMQVSLADLFDAVDVEFRAEALPPPDPRMHAGLQTRIAPSLPDFELLHDTPYAIGPIQAEGSYVRKYPTGDWMTSPQVFETIERPFTARSLLDFVAGERGLLVLHDGSQAFFREERGVRNLLTMKDPWDEDFWRPDLRARLRFVPHGGLSNADRYRLSAEFESPALYARVPGGGDLPLLFGSLFVEPENVVATALYRESEEVGENLPGYAGRGMGHPFVVRLVEFDGRGAEVRIRFPGAVARAVRTNLMGEAERDLEPEKAEPPPGLPEGIWSAVRLPMRPREIATVLLDLERGRKVPRDLDAYRGVWATVHREAGR